MAPRGFESDAPAGGRGRARRRFPPAFRVSRRVWLGDRAGRGGGSACSASQAAGPIQGGPRRPPCPAPPLPAGPASDSSREPDPLLGPPCADSLSRAELVRGSRDSPSYSSPLSRNLFLLRPTLQWVAATQTLGGPPS